MLLKIKAHFWDSLHCHVMRCWCSVIGCMGRVCNNVLLFFSVFRQWRFSMPWPSRGKKMSNPKNAKFSFCPMKEALNLCLSPTQRYFRISVFKLKFYTRVLYFEMCKTDQKTHLNTIYYSLRQQKGVWVAPLLFSVIAPVSACPKATFSSSASFLIILTASVAPGLFVLF